MNTLHDLRYSLRMLLHYPGLTLIAVIALALGIGLTATTFSIVYGTIIRGLPFEDSHQLVLITRNNLSAGNARLGVVLRDLWAWQDRQSTFHDIGGWLGYSFSLGSDEAAPEQRTGAFITPNLFDVLRVQPVLGRGFDDQDDKPGAAPVAIIGHTVWQNRFAGDPGVLGRTIRANGEPKTIVGVMPEGFGFPTFEDVWFPLTYNPDNVATGGGPGFNSLARLTNGVSMNAGRDDLNTIARQLEQEYPETNTGIGVNVESYIETRVGSELVAIALTMLGTVFGVLLIACSNVANLLLARAAVRAKEMAIRSALGASRGRVIVLLFTEALALACLGGLAGIGVAWVGIRLFNISMVANFSPVPFWVDISLNGMVLLFVVALIVAATLIAGTIPALQASGANLNVVLQDESRGTSSLRLGRFSRVLVVLEIALSCGLLIPAGLMTKSAVQVADMDFGFSTDDIFIAGIPLYDRRYPDSDTRVRFYDDLVGRLKGKPGVINVALTSALPGLGAGGTAMGVEGVTYQTERDFPMVRWAAVTPDFFQTFNVEIRSGRAFELSDDLDGERVAIVNESFVDRYLHGSEPLGRRIRFGRSASDTVWRTIVGVAPDMMINRRRRGGVMDEGPEGVYLPLAQVTTLRPKVAIRSSRPPLALTDLVRTELAAVDPDQALSDVNTLQDAINDLNWMYRMLGTLFGIFGLTALCLASIGLYGVMAFSVSRRTGEFGVRMSLGASAGSLLRLILKEGGRHLLIGLVFGLLVAALLSRLLSAILFGVEPTDPFTVVVVVAALGTTGLVACLVPAMRATSVDPMEALRIE
ncbi:MAG: ABC transporter permease [Gemmatimonadota bacterium]|nr:MAG: ABC transporter permease [Gemmatimonadota bacterium]